jgi:hypothetical protein
VWEGNYKFLRELFYFFEPPVTKSQMDRNFARDFELLESIAHYFGSTNYESIYLSISFECGDMSTNEGRKKIQDSEVLNAINKLKRRGYHVFSMGNNAVIFQRWSNLDNGRGIVYSLNGVEPNYGVDPQHPLYGSASMPAQIMFLTKLEPLSELNWYYYEEDYNEWRVRNRGN